MSQTIENKCQTCQKVSQDLLRCANCKKTYYCNQECQKKQWPQHKLTCNQHQVKNPEVKEKKSEKINQKEEENTLSEFGKLQNIGMGNFSVIYKTTSKLDKKTYALKQVQKAKVQRIRKQADVLMEKHCLNKLKECQYVVKLYKTFQDQLSLYFQMEFPEKGQLWDHSKTFGVVSESIFKYYVTHIIKALSIIHNQYQIVHRDLKPQNILLNSNNEIKFIDFGTAKDLSRPDIKGSGNGAKGKKVFDHYVGTPNYMAPQCIHNQASEKISDIYSLSGVLYFLKVGSPPFSGASEYLVFTKSLETKILTPKELFTNQLQDLVSKMNEKQINKRISLSQVMAHPYFAGIDWDNLPNYNQAVAEETPLEKYLIEIANQLQKQYQDKGKESIEIRKKNYDEAKSYLLKALKEVPFELSENQQSNLNGRIFIMDIQLQILLNIPDDLNVGFTEVYQNTTNKIL